MRVKESKFFSKRYRAVSKLDGVKIYTGKVDKTILDRVSFDSEYKDFSSVDHFVSSILSDIVLSIEDRAKTTGEQIFDLEATASVDISNPLTVIGVQGFDDKPDIACIKIRLYMFTFLEREDADSFVNKALEKSIILNTLKDKINIDLQIEYIS